MYQKIHDILEGLSASVHWVGPEDAVNDVSRIMKLYRVGSVLVVENDEVLGIISERDIVTRVVDTFRDPVSTFAREIMSTHVVSLPPDATVRACLDLMTERRIRHMPIMKGGSILAVVAIEDLVRVVLEQRTLVPGRVAVIPPHT